MATREEIREAVKKAPPKRTMAKQNIIKEGLIELCRERTSGAGKVLADEILEYLHSQGVVKKIDREFDLDDEALMANILPDVFNGSLDAGDYYEESDKYKVFMEPILEALKEAGYVAVESLIEEPG